MKISRRPDDRQLYESRQKFLHDEEARLIHAREEGREEGLLVGKIQLLQQLLGERQQDVSELGKLGTDALSSTLSDLQQRLRSRPG